MQSVLQFRQTTKPPICLKCGYQLTGLADPRCPECGRAFDPADPGTYTRPNRLWPVLRVVGECFVGAVTAVIFSICVHVDYPWPMTDTTCFVFINPLILLLARRASLGLFLGGAAVVLYTLALVVTSQSELGSDIGNGLYNMTLLLINLAVCAIVGMRNHSSIGRKQHA